MPNSLFRDPARIISTMEAQIASFTENNIILERDLGTADAGELVEKVRILEKTIQNLQPTPEQIIIGDDAADIEEAQARLSAFAGKIKRLNAAMESLEAQLVSLYEERTKLEQELGRSDADEIIAAFHELSAK
jgi:chromosome segregation ATPase